MTKIIGDSFFPFYFLLQQSQTKYIFLNTHISDLVGKTPRYETAELKGRNFFSLKWKLLSRVQLFLTPWTIQSMHGILQARILEWVRFSQIILQKTASFHTLTNENVSHSRLLAKSHYFSIFTQSSTQEIGYCCGFDMFSPEYLCDSAYPFIFITNY